MLLDLLRGEGGALRGGPDPGHHGDLAQVRVAALLVTLGHGLLELPHLNLLQVGEVGPHSD